MEITNARQARTLSPSHMRQCIMSESRFDFLRELVKDVPNISWADEEDGPVPPASNGNNTLQRTTSIERPKRNYQRPVSFDCSVLDQQQPIEGSSTRRNYADMDSPSNTTTGILKRKLLDNARKATSVDGYKNLSWKRAVLDPSLASLRESSAEDSPRDLSSDRLPLLLPPSVNLSSDSISSPIIKIDYSQPSIGATVPGGPTVAHSGQITPIINVDFSKLLTAAAPLPSGSNGATTTTTTTNNNTSTNNNNPQKLALLHSVASLDAASLATPNLTTPTRLNYAPSFDSVAMSGSGSGVLGLPTNAATSSSLDLDEDYDNI